MTSRLLSQIFNQNSASIYETLRQHDAAASSDSDIDDLEERAGMHTGPNLQHEDDSDEATNAFELRHRSPVPEEPHFASPQSRQPFLPTFSRSRSNQYPPQRYKDDDDNTEVPESLLFEAGAAATADNSLPGRAREGGRMSSATRGAVEPGRGFAARDTRLEEQWQAATAHEPLRKGEQAAQEARKRLRMGMIDPKGRALWKWANVDNLDNFLIDVYDYYIGKGIYSIMLARLLNSLSLLFVVSFSTFLGLCIDYNAIHNKKSLSEIVLPRCMSRMSGTTTFVLWIISFYWVIKVIQYVLDIRRLWDIHNFFVYLLEIPDSDMQTISWQEIVARLMALRDANPNTSNTLHIRDHRNQSKQRMDAHDIANRIMRKDNYMIALFNKDVLDLTIPLPVLRRRRGMLTKNLEWSINLCVLDFFFDDQGQLHPLFLRDTHRRTLSDALRRRFLFAGIMNILFAPFIATYFLVMYLLENLNDFIRTPARIGHRQYTPLAEWKFREFNEVYHLFHMRLNMSYPAAEAYVEQFPKEKTVQLARFINFVASSLLGVLAIGTLIDYELISGFEITPGLNALACIGILTTIVAVSKGMLPEENTVYDPEWSIRNVIQHTHYMPAAWKGKLHSDDVKRDFMTLYDLKISIFLHEVLSVIFTPFVLWFSLPKCSDQIIDFFREFTVHVDGVGYVCSFAHFNFQRPGQENVEDLREDYFSTKDNKMLSSYIGFIDQYHAGQLHRGNTGRRQYAAPNRLFVSSPIMAGDMPGPGGSKWASSPRVAANPSHSNYRDPLARSHATMMPSTLLDHHHQPPPGMLNRNSRHPIFHPSSGESLKEEDEDVSTHGGKGERYRSNLGESFMSTRLSGTMPASDDDQRLNAGAGVLDLLNQYILREQH